MKHSHLHVGAEFFYMHNVISNMQGAGDGWSGVAHSGDMAMQWAWSGDRDSEDVTPASSTAAWGT